MKLLQFFLLFQRLLNDRNFCFSLFFTPPSIAIHNKGNMVKGIHIWLISFLYLLKFFLCFLHLNQWAFEYFFKVFIIIFWNSLSFNFFLRSSFASLLIFLIEILPFHPYFLKLWLNLFSFLQLNREFLI